MQDVNFTWPQGEDMYISLRYKEGNNKSTAKPVDLAGGYTALMSLAASNAPQTPLVTLSSDTGEIVLSTGVSEPNIRVRLDKSHTVSATPPGTYLYDLFLTNATGDTIKVVEGSIKVKRSITQTVVID